MALIDGLSRKQLMGPLLTTINPLLWEIGHVAYFYEYWVLRQHLKMPPIREDSDSLYDSITIAHDDRWSLPLPGLQQTLAYPEPAIGRAGHSILDAGGLSGDASIPGGAFMLGASQQDGF
ncbi:MAG: ergothioneine biosynthesis protein EgtB, partial [Gammaproteobacteria bacterium]